MEKDPKPHMLMEAIINLMNSTTTTAGVRALPY